ncbi:hypothetical protein PG988_010741 [Apiospora saccharicola]
MLAITTLATHKSSQQLRDSATGMAAAGTPLVQTLTHPPINEAAQIVPVEAENARRGPGSVLQVLEDKISQVAVLSRLPYLLVRHDDVLGGRLGDPHEPVVEPILGQHPKEAVGRDVTIDFVLGVSRQGPESYAQVADGAQDCETVLQCRWMITLFQLGHPLLEYWERILVIGVNVSYAVELEVEHPLVFRGQPHSLQKHQSVTVAKLRVLQAGRRCEHLHEAISNVTISHRPMRGKRIHSVALDHDGTAVFLFRVAECELPVPGQVFGEREEGLLPDDESQLRRQLWESVEGGRTAPCSGLSETAVDHLVF